ncbi:MAG: amidohydrolase family protein [Alphaproteobacteria bacterium]|nr:amidohydrolase family protein [Alphaproteobacteria bacterium]
MAYVEGRIVHDADSHLMELADCLDDYLDPKFRADYDALPKLKAWPRNGTWVRQARTQHDDPKFRAGAMTNILTRKNYEALGAFIAEDRPRALDALGFASQLVFTTWSLGNFDLDRTNVDLAYATASAHNRMMADFCGVDRRFLPTAYIPLVDPRRSLACAFEALARGCKGLTIPSRCPPGHSPSHIDFDPLWTLAQDAGVPILFHVGGEEKINPDYFSNGLPKVKDFHGGEENFTSVSYMMIPHSVMLSLAAMIFDGVLDRFPELKFGVIELGASWLPSWMRFMDAGVNAFRKGEDRLQKLSLMPSEFVRRQVRVTPYPHEDAGWIIANSAPEICLFSSDYPHVEGGRNPLKRFGESLQGCPDAWLDAFYCDNFIDLMGQGLASDLRRPKHHRTA